MEKLITIKNLKGLYELSKYLEDKECISFDTETTGVDKDSEIVGFSVCADLEEAYYVVLSYWDLSKQALVYLETKNGTQAFLQKLQGKKLIMHNAVFDCMMVNNNFQVSLMPSVFADTMILAQLVDENRRVGLKELGVSIYGDDAAKEQTAMKDSVVKNGGVLNNTLYELYKADADLLALYGAKDTLLTLKLFYHMVPDLMDQKLDPFFFDDESMPLLKGPTYDLNSTGLRVDPDKLQQLKAALEIDCMEAKAYIHREIENYVKDKYPGTSKANTFNLNAGQQLSWLVFIKLGQEFNTLTDAGKALCLALNIKVPYAPAAKRDFIRHITSMHDHEYAPASINPKTGKLGRPKKIGHPWIYMSCGAESIKKSALKYKWAAKLLEYKKNLKLLNTYVEGIQSRMKYGIIRPSFLQHGTTSGRYSSKQPNFQNLPRDDKRVKACIVSRPGKIFVGADYAQLEPRVFASFSKDERLLKCFEDGDDFYSVIGAEVFGKNDCTFKKDDSPDSFPVKHKKLRDVAKVIALATPYGTTAPQMSGEMALKAGQIRSIQECQEIINDYFANYPSVEKLMLDAHAQAKKEGVVYSLFGRPRRIPEAKSISGIYGKNTPHGELPRVARNLLNLAMNHPIQSTGASIMNRASIAVWNAFRELEQADPAWAEVKIVLQVHDELIIEGPEHLEQDMITILKACMENTTTLPGVKLLAEPKSGRSLAELK